MSKRGGSDGQIGSSHRHLLHHWPRPCDCNCPLLPNHARGVPGVSRRRHHITSSVPPSYATAFKQQAPTVCKEISMNTKRFSASVRNWTSKIFLTLLATVV